MTIQNNCIYFVLTKQKKAMTNTPENISTWGEGEGCECSQELLETK